MELSLLRKAIEIYRKEGATVLLEKSSKYIRNKIDPKVPIVNDDPKLSHVWFLKHPYNWYFTMKHGKGIDVMKEDWDTLILLDACRYDTFEELNHINGELVWKISQGVDSKEFITRNFSDRELYDTVYVTANPHVKYVNDGVFYDVVSEPISKWDPEIQCVRPKEVTAAAIEAHQKYPNKRMIVHYMQPHDPPLGPTAEKLRKKYNMGGPPPGDQEQDGDRLMPLVVDGRISEEVAYISYKETLQIVLEEVDVLLEEITGKAVISSDHGEMFGEKPYLLLPKLYEHYRNPKTIELCKVPWLEVDVTKNRRDIVSGDDGSVINMDESNIEEQLEALGYKS